MKNSNLKGVFLTLAAVGVALTVKKMSDRKKEVKGILAEYEIKGRTPFAFTDKIREMDDEKYAELKNRIKENFASKRCCNRHFRKENEAA
ncbi:hypothetical protein SAMN05421847_2952 [Halpernia humi]|uniref:Uncharacterized protein n=1 Tax=Halpernia humi TaxID=493375 RepID=A0A1H6BK63_9FLAO|nr:hypothetical protein [Halpernia humi]SEG61108.1 hypothetical protein SAMN05421847_2952 [Halpernia humi]